MDLFRHRLHTGGDWGCGTTFEAASSMGIGRQKFANLQELGVPWESFQTIQP